MSTRLLPTKTQNCNRYSKAKFTLDDSPSPIDFKTSSNIIKGLEISAKPQVKYFKTYGYIIKINLSRDKLRRET
ncbi:hypothetical protein KL86CIT2_530020 [uncultured Citrobacter sp.]|uniref:Uncharacterized protein n=1 Tax=uncultured Citrobacter sp. TaxID=200446 RepID=A0A212IKC6_9ENTR|nr:hypothetical protein KL86CIT2_530020 [uncultured Citrobacter sp.]